MSQCLPPQGDSFMWLSLTDITDGNQTAYNLHACESVLWAVWIAQNPFVVLSMSSFMKQKFISTFSELKSKILKKNNVVVPMGTV